MAHIRRIQYRDSNEGYIQLRHDLSLTLNYVIQQIAIDSINITSENSDVQNQLKKQIENLASEGRATIYPDRKVKSIDALATYGESAIEAIMDIMRSTARTEIREYALDAIKKIRERSRPKSNTY